MENLEHEDADATVMNEQDTDVPIWNDMPDEVLFKVLAKMSTNSLLRTIIRVCKRWRMLVFDRQFIQMLKRDPEPDSYFIKFCDREGKQAEAYSPRSDVWSPIVPSLCTFVTTEVSDLFLLDSAGGLVLLQSSELCEVEIPSRIAFWVNSYSYKLFVVNPFNKQSIELPCIPQMQRFAEPAKRWLSYLYYAAIVVDLQTDSYKVLTVDLHKRYQSPGSVIRIQEPDVLTFNIFDSRMPAIWRSGELPFLNYHEHPPSRNFFLSTVYHQEALYCTVMLKPFWYFFDDEGNPAIHLGDDEHVGERYAVYRFETDINISERLCRDMGFALPRDIIFPRLLVASGELMMVGGVSIVDSQVAVVEVQQQMRLWRLDLVDVQVSEVQQGPVLPLCIVQRECGLFLSCGDYVWFSHYGHHLTENNNLMQTVIWNIKTNTWLVAQNGSHPHNLGRMNHSAHVFGSRLEEKGIFPLEPRFDMILHP